MSADSPPLALAAAAPALDGAMVRRVVPSDNSCLFAALGYVVHRDRGRAAALRERAAAAVAADADTFGEGFLGKPNAEYVAWLRDRDHWGGAIELSVLARVLNVQIGAADIVSKRLDVYGSDLPCPSDRVYLLYDGIHYDAVALSPVPGGGAPEDFDTTRFVCGDTAAEAAVRALCAESHAARHFTDTANFALRCLVCQKGLKGENEAREHAKATGHINFGEY